MGLFDKLKEKKEEIENQKKSAVAPSGKYAETCAMCGGTGTDKKWMGQYWHKKCVRSAKRASKKMI